MTLQYKAFSPVLKALDDAGQGQAIIVQLNTVDRDNDVTIPLAFGEQHVKLLFGHDWKQPAVGDARLYESGNFVIADFAVNLNMQAGREIYESLKWDHGRHQLQEWSYGFQVLDSEPGMYEGKSVRFLKKIHAFEISPVVVGSGIGTGTLALKAHPPEPGGNGHPMGPTDHLGEALISLRSGRQHVQWIRRIIDDEQSAAKTVRVHEYVDAAIDDLDSAMKHYDEVTDLLKSQAQGAPAGPSHQTLAEWIALLRHAGYKVAEPQETAPQIPAEDVEPALESSEEATPEPRSVDEDRVDGKASSPIATAVESLIVMVDQVAARLEDIKRARATESPRYPHGRPMGADRLAQVDQLVSRLSRLKTSAEAQVEQDAAQEDLLAMTERLKRLGVAV